MRIGAATTKFRSRSVPSTVLTEPEAAAHLRVSYATMRRWRYAGLGPAYLRMQGTIRYAIADLEDFIKNGRVKARTKHTKKSTGNGS
jgi:hypothetical protein